MKEIWIPIAGYEKCYEVSNFGRIKSLKRKVRVGIPGQHPYWLKERILKPYIDKKGYLHIDLKVKGTRKNKKLHQLVAQAFIKNHHNLKFINHKDGNKKNNQIENLEWCSIAQNNKHAWENGLTNNKGELNGRSKLTALQVVEIRLLFERKTSYLELAKRFNTSTANIGLIIRRERWKLT